MQSRLCCCQFTERDTERSRSTDPVRFQDIYGALRRILERLGPPNRLERCRHVSESSTSRSTKSCRRANEYRDRRLDITDRSWNQTWIQRQSEGTSALASPQSSRLDEGHAIRRAIIDRLRQCFRELHEDNKKTSAMKEIRQCAFPGQYCLFIWSAACSFVICWR